MEAYKVYNQLNNYILMLLQWTIGITKTEGERKTEESCWEKVHGIEEEKTVSQHS